MSRRNKFDIQLNRREFLKTSAGGLGSLMLGGLLANPALAAESGGPEHTLVYLFLEGGMDALSVLAPKAKYLNQENESVVNPERSVYDKARTMLDNGIPAHRLLDLPGRFGLHPDATGLHNLFKRGQLSFIMGAGCDHPSTSHFYKMDNIAAGKGPESSHAFGGFLARALNGMPAVQTDGSFDAISLSRKLHKSLLGSQAAVAFPNLSVSNLGYSPDGLHSGRALADRLDDMFLKNLHRPQSVDHQLAKIANILKKSVNSLADESKNYPKDNPGTSVDEGQKLSDHKERYKAIPALGDVVRLLEFGVRVPVMTLTIGGWDTHTKQGTLTEDGAFRKKLKSLSDSLDVFVRDLERKELLRRTTIVVMSEFGRRLEANATGGTDHGHGGLIMVLGDKSKLQNSKEGAGMVLAPSTLLRNLDDNGNLKVTYDWRNIMGEILKEQFKVSNLTEDVPVPKSNSEIAAVFKGLSYVSCRILG